MKLLTGPLSMFGAKVLIAAAEKGIALEVEEVAYDMATASYPGHAEVDRINPKRQVPILIDQGLELFDSTLIFEYFEDLRPEPPLWPGEPRSRAAARLVELKSDEIWFPKFRQLGRVGVGSPESEQARNEALEAYRQIEATLNGRTWMAGAFSYADIAVYINVLMAGFFGLRVPEQLTGLSDWRRRMEARPSVRAAREGMLRYIARQRAAEPA